MAVYLDREAMMAKAMQIIRLAQELEVMVDYDLTDSELITIEINIGRWQRMIEGVPSDKRTDKDTTTV